MRLAVSTAYTGTPRHTTGFGSGRGWGNLGRDSSNWFAA
jgi:hypothetical protein